MRTGRIIRQFSTNPEVAGKVPTIGSRYGKAGWTAAILATGLAGAGAYLFSEHQKATVRDIKAQRRHMKFVNRSIHSLDDVIAQSRKMQSLEQFTYFWRTVDFNQYMHSATDYAALLNEVNLFISRSFAKYSDADDITPTTKRHKNAQTQIVKRLLFFMVGDGLKSSNASFETYLFELLNSIAIADVERQQYYFCADFQNYLVQQLQEDINTLVSSKSDFMKIIECPCITDNTKKTLLNKHVINTIVPDVKRHDEFTQLMLHADFQSKQMIMDALTAPVIADLKRSLDNATLADVQTVLTRLKDLPESKEDRETGVFQKRFLQLLGDHKAVTLICNNKTSLIKDGYLQQDAIYFVQNISPTKELYCGQLFKPATASTAAPAKSCTFKH